MYGLFYRNCVEFFRIAFCGKMLKVPQAGVAQLVEHLPSKQDVARSSRVARYCYFSRKRYCIKGESGERLKRIKRVARYFGLKYR